MPILSKKAAIIHKSIGNCVCGLCRIFCNAFETHASTHVAPMKQNTAFYIRNPYRYYEHALPTSFTSVFGFVHEHTRENFVEKTLTHVFARLCGIESNISLRMRYVTVSFTRKCRTDVRRCLKFALFSTAWSVLRCDRPLHCTRGMCECKTNIYRQTYIIHK